MINFELDVKNYLATLEPKDIQSFTNNQIASLYYQYKGLDQDTSVKEWLLNISLEVYPHQIQLLNIIRKIRNEDPALRKISEKGKNNERTSKL